VLVEEPAEECPRPQRVCAMVRVDNDVKNEQVDARILCVIRRDIALDLRLDWLSG
jgi:hypothetical protein